MNASDLRGQREALTEDVDGSGNEQDAAPEDSKTIEAKAQKRALRDSAMPCVVVAALLLTFGALAATAIFVVTQAFGQDTEPAALVAANATAGRR